MAVCQWQESVGCSDYNSASDLHAGVAGRLAGEIVCHAVNHYGAHRKAGTVIRFPGSIRQRRGEAARGHRRVNIGAPVHPWFQIRCRLPGQKG